MNNEVRVYLGLGSNLKQPHRQLSLACHHINRIPDTRLIQFAPRYQTKAWGVTDQADFINTVVAINTRLTPLALLKHIKTIEYRLMGRTVNQRWHSRCIDIDILYYAGKPFKRPQLRLPHPFIAARCFVLRPLFDLYPIDLPLTVRKAITLKKNHCLPMTAEKNRLENNTIQKISRANP